MIEHKLLYFFNRKLGFNNLELLIQTSLELQCHKNLRKSFILNFGKIAKSLRKIDHLPTLPIFK